MTVTGSQITEITKVPENTIRELNSNEQFFAVFIRWVPKEEGWPLQEIQLIRGIVKVSNHPLSPRPFALPCHCHIIT